MIRYLYSTERGSGGSPIMNLSNGKIIGIHIGADSKGRYNIGTFLKYPVEDLIDKFKDYINSETQILDFDNKNKILENELKL